MKFELNLREMTKQEARFRGIGIKNPTYIFDSNALKYLYRPTRAKIVITSGVRDEVLNLPEVFPAQSLHKLEKMIRPDGVEHFVSEEDERMIFEASIQDGKAKHRKVTGIGWVDTQQISYALRLARKGRQAILVSNDGDIFKTVAQINYFFPELASNLICLTTRKYFGRIYAKRFSEFDSKSRKFLVMQIEKDYRVS